MARHASVGLAVADSSEHNTANTLISAPTGSGKTQAAFLAAIDRLVCDGLESPLADATHMLYVSPLKALSNDIHALGAAALRR